MNSKFLEKQEKLLNKKRQILEKELERFANKDPHVKDNWETIFPRLGILKTDASESADVVEEYDLTLPIEHVLELDLQKVNQALKNIKKGVYGQCKNCHQRISLKRLEAYPEADICLKCKNKKT